ncbi:PspC domain-containing protein [Streptomyces sp. V3I7]|uniref:PspC domain-containing protein n=1 Tax=Streptomyces sp. V3I7 TaxID=3042278 RepID=UPI0027894D7E|nr:PspC domain-containing protein [Streptomyces sp. V3I7]MDQ0992567.1 phage shock protein PspC (stress-responsive transcriptional regulator) [Streptomyces sp. V3I7]
MTDHDRAATGPGPGSGPRPASGAGPADAAGAAAPGSPGSPASPAGDSGDAAGDAPALRRFRRDRRHKMVAGVCAGLGRHTDMDPVIFRITLAVLAATGGIGLIFYGFAWLFVPYEDEEENEVRKLLTGRVDGQALAGVLFALVGCWVFLTMLRNGGVLTFGAVLSLLLAGAGYWSQRRDAPDTDPSAPSGPRSNRVNRGNPIAAQAAADAPPEAQAPPVPASYPSWWRDPIVKDGTHVGGTGYLWGPQNPRDRDIAAAVNIGLGRTGRREERPPSPHPAPRRARGPRWIGGWVFLLALAAGGLGTRLAWDTHPVGTSMQIGLACALAVFGLGIAVSAFLGRTGAGSVFLAMLTAALLAATAAVPQDISTHWIRTTWHPAAASDVHGKYDLGTGVGTLDLTGVRVGRGQTVRSGAEVGVGRLRVIVPPDVAVRMSIDVGVGDVRLPGDNGKDVDVKPGRHEEVTLAPTTGGRRAGTLDLGIRVGMGQVEVSRAAS